MYAIRHGTAENFSQIEARNFLQAFASILVSDPSDVNARIAHLTKHSNKMAEPADNLQQIFVDNAATKELAQLMSDAWLEVSMGAA